MFIDTNCIYVMDSVYNQWDGMKVKKQNYRFVRFFSGGQVLFIYNEGMPDLELINNKNVGIPGYYYIEKDKIKISMFKNINGGILIDYSGEVSVNGNIVFYEQSTGGIFLAKAKEFSRKSFWSKVNVEKIIHYKPDW